MKITLMGYMGSGKTTIGKILSKKLDYKFYDLDDLIQKNQNNSIENIFKKYGELHFRNIENIVLKKFFFNKYKPYVLSVGGGTPCFYNNIYLMNKFSKTFYLKMDSFFLFKRLLLNENRPMIYNFKKNDLFKFIMNHLFKRTFFYEKSHKKIVINNKSKNEIIKEIYKYI
ncbi:shikimate kinase [Blattabacterium cuenoti]|uniref:shikimate kinase n=1 Tax=Blattabacterium cuenoti TaxID=1653831 RepID=UPI00163C4F8E|nr:shikimate kinase [Blattabacterium cuenoti]